MSIWPGVFLGGELARWRSAGRRATLWWRDDDARTPTPALARLLKLSDDRQTPLTLAVVPDGDRRPLAGALGTRPLVTVTQHGIDHENRREPGALGDLPLDWPTEEVARRVSAGWRRLEELPRAIPVYVPPWNDVPRALPSVLEQLGFVGLSAAEGHPSAGGPVRVDADVDILDWRGGGARFKGWSRTLGQIREALAVRRRAGCWSIPIGLNTHHLAHDEATWRFLDRFFAWSAAEPAIRWSNLETLIAEARPAQEQRRMAEGASAG